MGVVTQAVSGSGYREWNVTTPVRTMAATGQNYGFLIKDAVEEGTGSAQSFAARQTQTPPQLVVRFAAAD
jgi:large repetitive protein